VDFIQERGRTPAVVKELIQETEPEAISNVDCTKHFTTDKVFFLIKFKFNS